MSFQKSKMEIERSRNLIVHCSGSWHLPKFERRVVWEWSTRLTSTLGRAYPQRMLVRLSTLLREPEYSIYFKEVLCHEIAHVAAFEMFGPVIELHGKEWQRLIQKAGFVPRRGISISEHVPSANDNVLYEHTCPVCGALRVARRHQPSWRCVECHKAGLDGEMLVKSRPAKDGVGHV